ncbi:hypothetical protein A2715_00045 [Candidatus Woesebacteria bacterium RIFCSPHIGHO2_01_FULL_39_32]|uniref:Methyltransferase domain-containing protein n=1 Tax=Candidatus Woesebacteria bacterium RIFCSPLOWO2_01_FULL_39_25 TaxID=1802521 RepID=A0A1F8BND4_9BACT|nr:MAG: Methyltransferase family protein [Parcubacteria group bacterium GW2011_GWA1_38_7]OGM03424.1 MAG: hypothetical protein A2124_01740 [Candidatus Woesebacteria bacterium GWB1_37_5]OGM24956.1 MAG: hypothetical protein A2715_00045 [Candidatus Woesebacteria bacterium RIFCSPHIGHO2_01_FULL_39_32]OGM35485.1 MAG: hypothetical protein A3F01_02375 [Candidatus Woesebacteria bacterium RIFCSPHIGHO2_12_FULL_38_11]OGM65584.1 MAG: hypothetical protein A2893_01505 [Candidatus Woesebacteria bacterium RIFCSP
MLSASQKIKKVYQEKYKKYGVDPRSLCWHEKGAAHQRFRQFWAEIDFNNKSVLDVGCGFGEMAKFLRKRYEGVSYTGVDIVSEFIEEAKKTFPEYRFFARDYFSEPLPEKFDVVLASGVLNSNVENNAQWRKENIKIMFENTKKVLAFNMLGAYPQPSNDTKSNIWYADSLEILEYCMSLTRRVILRANYHPTDFTIFMYPLKK